MVIGVSEFLIDVTVYGSASISTTANPLYGVVGVGLDSTTSPTGVQSPAGGGGATGAYATTIANYRDYPGIGRHYFAWLEYSIANGTTTWVGANGGIQTGIYGTIFS